MNIRTKNILIERSVCFEEPLQYLKLVEEETIELASLSAEDSRDENESVRYDISHMMYDISDYELSGYESYPNEPSHLPKWAKKTLSSVGSNVRNLVDPRRTRADFQRVRISIY